MRVRRCAGAEGAKGAERPAPETPEAAEPPEPPPVPEAPEDSHRRRSATRVHIGSDILVAEDELVTDPVVAIGGSVTVLGKVDDDVVAVGGSVHLGPKAVVRGDVTSVGGRIEQSPGRRSTEGSTRFASDRRTFTSPGRGSWAARGVEPVHGWFKLFGTLLRLGLVLLLAMLVALVAARPVERIGLRAAQEPWLSGFTGLLAQLLFVPVLVLTVVILAVSMIGIPLLVLVPFGVSRSCWRAHRVHRRGAAAGAVGRRAGPPDVRGDGGRRDRWWRRSRSSSRGLATAARSDLCPITWMLGVARVLRGVRRRGPWASGRRCSRGSGRAARRTTDWVAPPPIPVYEGPSGV